MIDYKIREVTISNSFHQLVFDFDPPNDVLSCFLFTDSKLLFGQRFEKFNEILNNDFYEAGGNAYNIELSPQYVTITCTVDIEAEESVTIQRNDFVWVMNEWIRENKNIKSNDSENKAVHSTKLLRKKNKLLSKVCRLFCMLKRKKNG